MLMFWALFTIAETFERELDKLQAEETKGWITEFNAGLWLDGVAQETFVGTSWSKVGVVPGLHTVAVKTFAEPVERATGSILVKPAEIATMELKLTT